MNIPSSKRELFPELAPPEETEGQSCRFDRAACLQEQLKKLRGAARGALALAASREGLVMIAEGLMVLAGFVILAQAL